MKSHQVRVQYNFSLSCETYTMPPPFVYLINGKIMLIRNFVPPSLRNQITCHTVKHINFQICGISGKFHQVDISSFSSGHSFSHNYVSWFQEQLWYIDYPTSLPRPTACLSAVNAVLFSDPSCEPCLMKCVLVFIIIWHPTTTVLFTTITPF